MPLTPKQNRLVIALGVAVVGFTIDRLWFPPPAATAESLLARPPGADADPPAAGAAPPGQPRAPQANLARWGARGIQQRLQASTRAASTPPTAPRDAFFPVQPKPVAVVAPPAGGTAAEAKPRPQVDLAAEFLAHHRVTVIISSDGRGSPAMALVDDRMVRIGEGVGGFRLIAVEPRAALFEYADPKRRLRVRVPLWEDPALSDAPPLSDTPTRGPRNP